MNNTKFEREKSLSLQQAPSAQLSHSSQKRIDESSHSSLDSKSLSTSLTQAQNQLGLCLQRQRQVGFILREVKDILKR